MLAPMGLHHTVRDVLMMPISRYHRLPDCCSYLPSFHLQSSLSIYVIDRTRLGVAKHCNGGKKNQTCLYSTNFPFSPENPVYKVRRAVLLCVLSQGQAQQAQNCAHKAYKVHRAGAGPGSAALRREVSVLVSGRQGRP